MNSTWEWRQIGEIFEIGAGKTMSVSARNGSNQYPFLRTSNIFWDKIDLSTVDTMAFTASELVEKSLKQGDLLLCEGGDVGRCAIWLGEIEPMFFQNHLHRLRPLHDNVIPRFYVFFFQYAFTQTSLYEGAENKTTIPNLSRNRLASLLVPVPPKKIQQKIVNILSIIRKLISVTEKFISLSSELKQSAMYQLFTCGLRGEPQKQTEIGPVPESWKVIKILDICYPTEFINITNEADRKIKYIDVSSVSSESLSISDSKEYILRNAPGRARKKVIKGDIIFATIRPTLLRLAKIAAVYDNQVCSTAFCVLRCSSEHKLNEFLYYAIQRPEFIKILGGIETGSSYPAITDSQLKAQLIPCPSDSREMMQIVEILSAIDQKIDILRKKKTALEELFKTMLHKLMTGEIRVDELDLSALEKETH